jgi:hydrogenase maturation protease
VADALRRVVIGIGNPDRGDDGVGRHAARMLERIVPADVRVVEQDGGAAALIETLRDADCAFMIDAVVSGAPVGTVLRLDCGAEIAIPAKGGASSHGLGLSEAIALARVLGSLPEHCVIYGVEAARFTPGTGLSPEVADGMCDVVRRIVQELYSAEGGVV